MSGGISQEACNGIAQRKCHINPESHLTRHGPCILAAALQRVDSIVTDA